MDLAIEADYFNKSLFKGKLSLDILTKYANAHNCALFSTNLINNELVDAVIRNQLDIEAIEFVLRLKNRNNILTKKIHILTYLIESQRQFNDLFLNYRFNRFKALSALIFHSFRSTLLFLKGWYLIKRYRLV